MNYKKELSIAFGDYCEVYDGTDNTTTSRSVPCIALFPCKNSAGSWEFMNLQTKSRIRCSQWIKMKTTEMIIDVMNHFDDEPEVQVEQQEVAAPTEAQNANNPEAVTADDDEVPDLVPGSVEDDSDDEDDDEDGNEDDNEEKAEATEETSAPVAMGTRKKSGNDIGKPSRYSLATKIDKRTVNDEKRKAAIEKSETEEVLLLYTELKAAKPVYYDEMNGVKPYNMLICLRSINI